MGNQVLENEFVGLEITDGILIVTYVEGLYITLAIAKEMLKSRILLTENRSFPTLIDSSKVRGIDKEARNYFSSEEGTKGVVAAALVTNSVFTIFLANFFLSVNFVKPLMPAKLFNDKDSALEWLEQFKEK